MAFPSLSAGLTLSLPLQSPQMKVLIVFQVNISQALALRASLRPSPRGFVFQSWLCGAGSRESSVRMVEIVLI